MMKNKKHGFTIMEMLVALLIVSLVLAAVIPTVTKKRASESNNLWKSEYSASPIGNRNIYSEQLMDKNVGVMVGVKSPLLEQIETDYGNDIFNPEVDGARDEGKTQLVSDVLTRPTFQKLAILKSVEDNDWRRSHLSFYNKSKTGLVSKFENVGRFTADKDNMGFGILSLASMDSGIGNVAYGHYTLASNKEGNYNVAVGERALMKDIGPSSSAEAEKRSGSYNVAVGYKALENSERTSLNTAVGAFALNSNSGPVPGDATDSGQVKGTRNVAVGYASLMMNTKGFKNTAVGLTALQLNNNGYDNVGLGYQALMFNKDGNENVALGNNAMARGENNRSIAIGVGSLYWSGKENGSSGSVDNIAIGYHSMKGPEDIHSIDEAHPFPTGKTVIGNQNVAVGNYALENITTACYNVAVGNQALMNNVGPAESATGDDAKRGFYNIGVGYAAAGDNTTGRVNVAVGANALRRNKTGDANIAIGDSAIQRNDSMRNVAIGSHALYWNKNTNDNVAIGFMAMRGRSTAQEGNPATGTWAEGKENVAVGSQAMRDLEEGEGNVAIGKEALVSIKGGKKNVAVGNHSLKANTNHQNTAVGYASLNINEAGHDNTGIGYAAMEKIEGSYNTAVGEFALRNKNNIDSVSLYNTALGYAAGENSSGSKNIFLGYMAGHSETGNNKLYIGIGDSAVIKGENIDKPADAILTFDAKTVKISGDLKGNGGTSTISGFASANFTGNVTAANIKAPSDSRLKNIKGDSKAGLAEINKIEVKNYTYKNDKEKRPRVGVIAQQLQKVFPNSVFKGEDGYLTISKDEIFYAMVNAIKELGAKIQDIIAKIAGLDKRITELESQNKLLIKQNNEIKKENTAIRKENTEIKKQNSQIEKRLSKLEGK